MICFPVIVERTQTYVPLSRC